MSLRKSSSRRNGSNSFVFPKPNARRRCTPAPSRVGLDLISRLTGRIDILDSSAENLCRLTRATGRLVTASYVAAENCSRIPVYRQGRAIYEFGVITAQKQDDVRNVLRLRPLCEIGVGHCSPICIGINDARKYSMVNQPALAVLILALNCRSNDR